MKDIKKYFYFVLLLGYMLCLIIWSENIKIYIVNSIKICIEVIIPSLYIFMILSDFLITSNMYAIIGKPFSFVSRYIFKIPEHLFSVFLISSIAGYPVGAKLLSNLLQEKIIDKQDAEDMLTYCYLSGPAFICGAVGVNVFSDVKIGVLIFGSIIFSNVIIAIIIGITRTPPPPNTYKDNLEIKFGHLIMSIANGGKNIFSICTIIVFFSSLICIIEKSGLVSFVAKIIDDIFNYDYSNSVAVIKSFLEISNIILFDDNIKNLPIITALVSWGGLCVLFQIKGLISNRISMISFLFFRVMSMFLSYFICEILCIITFERYLYSSSSIQVGCGQNSPILTLFLLIMTILFLLKFSIEKKRKI